MNQIQFDENGKPIIPKVENGEDNVEVNEEDEEIDLKEKRYIDTDKGSDRLIRELYTEYDIDKYLDLRPDFQRGYVWDPRMAGKLIESILLDIPIPIIYTAEDPNRPGKELVIDGQQRLTAIFSFIKGTFPDGKKFKLPSKKTMKFYPELANQSFEEIEKEKPGFLKENFLNRKLRVVKILKKSDEDAKFMVFERLNTGARQLSDQELRNCIYHGKYNNFIKKLAQNDDFRFCLGIGKEEKRMTDSELVLRFLAFHHTNFIDYEAPIKKFLNDDMKSNAKISDEELIKLEELFKKCISLCRTIWGKKAFRRFSVGDDETKEGHFETKLNKALYEILMWGFTKYDKNQVMKYQDAIFEELINLQINDKKFFNSIYAATNKLESIQYRFKVWWESLQKIMGTAKTEKRCFSFNIKKELFDKNPVCKKCGSRINDIDDAAVDHVKHYWRGGETIPENARLLHRYCNIERGGRED